MAKYGIHRYIGDEGSNLMLGQAGFVVVAANESTATHDSTNTDWVAFKVVDGADATVTVTVHTGQGFTELDFNEGDMLFGPFKQVNNKTGSAGKLIVYYG